MQVRTTSKDIRVFKNKAYCFEQSLVYKTLFANSYPTSKGLLKLRLVK